MEALCLVGSVNTDQRVNPQWPPCFTAQWRSWVHVITVTEAQPNLEPWKGRALAYPNPSMQYVFTVGLGQLQPRWQDA